ncbi:MAG: asparagine synthase-related protein [Methanobrevibacter sp.]
MEYTEKIKNIEEILKDKNICVCFSGGADSSLIADIARKVSNKTILVTFDNGVLPRDFIKESEKQAKKFNLEHIIVKEDLMKNKAFCENNHNRCLICRENLYNKIKELANEKNLDLVVDGTNMSDLVDDRPGVIAKYENNIISPLVESEMETKDVFKYLKDNNIEYLKSTTCLATRIKQNTKLTHKNINQINTAERIIKNITKNDIVKVRNIDGMALIETDNIDKLLNKRIIQLIELQLKAISFNKIALNISKLEKNNEKLFIYKPCQEEDSKIMFERELPYKIDIEKTKKCFDKEFNNVKYSKDMGILMFNINTQNITVFNTGKIVLRRINSKEEGEEILMKLLPLIRREI